ncbi:MAG: hypothetical protein M3N47_13175 [Chloroflexota bacterium]|nr:hypothetical protein [Chloroflexota bacterium]
MPRASVSSDGPHGGSSSAALAVLVAGALALSACGDDGGGGSPAPRKLAVEVVQAGENRFRLSAPRSVEAGLVEITLTSPAGSTSHDAQLVRVEGDHTLDEVVKTLAVEGAPIPPWMAPAGGVGQTDAGATGRSVQRVSPGTYHILDTGQPEGDDVKSYFETGAVATFKVTGDAAAANLPHATAKITAREYAFSVRGLTAGRNEVEFANAGNEPHHVIAMPYREGATLADVKKAFGQQGPPDGPPPVDFENLTGSAVLERGTRQVTELQLKRGRYALVCFVSDRRGGPPHVAKGMIAEAVVR